MARTASPSLRGQRVIVTRERPGELGAMLSERGADVVHVPLISIGEPPDGGAALQAELARLDSYDWVLVTSAPGAERVGAAVRDHDDVRLGAVGTATARCLAELAGRAVDLIPERQIADAFAEAFDQRCPTSQRVLIAQADRAADTLATRLQSSGHEVTVVTAYATLLQAPAVDDVYAAMIDGVDALLLASGSAAESWVAAVGPIGPRLVVAIGPTTAERARRFGLKVDAVAADHSLVGLVEELERRIAPIGWRPT